MLLVVEIELLTFDTSLDYC